MADTEVSAAPVVSPIPKKTFPKKKATTNPKVAKMADTEVSAPPVIISPSPKKTSPKKKATTKPKVAKKPAEHPKYLDMITKAIKEVKDRKGASRQAILNYVVNNNKVEADVKKV